MTSVPSRRVLAGLALALGAATHACRGAAPVTTPTLSLVQAAPGAGAPPEPDTSDTLASPVDGDGNLAAGHYLGYFRATGQTTRMRSRLDIIPLGPGADGQPAYRAILRIHRGALSSHEYISAYFPTAAWQASTKTLQLTPAGDALTLPTLTVTGQTLRGVVQTSTDGVGGELILNAAPAAAWPTAPLAPVFTGHYAGTCSGTAAAVQIEASKWRGSFDGPLFTGYRTSGRRGAANLVSCGPGQLCTSSSFNQADLNFFGGLVNLRRGAAPFACQHAATGLVCDATCTLVQTAPHAVVDAPEAERTFARTESARETSQAPAPQAGQYYGYLHHEQTNRYQLVALNATPAPASGAPLTAEDADAFGSVATLYFGTGDSSEFIAFRFDTPPPANATTAAASRQHPLVVLDGPGEAFLVVDSWTPQRLTAVWYGKTFGRLGTVVLQRDLVPELPGQQLVGAVGGLYAADTWELELSAAASVSAEATDFYPMHLYGWAKEKIAHARRHVIEDGVYDFRTGALVMRLDDGRTVLGRVVQSRDGRAGLNLYWAPSPRVGTPLTTGKPMVFWRLGDSMDARQARSELP